MWDREAAIAVRKRNRLTGIRYNENGAYFITICTRDRRNLFWTSDDRGVESANHGETPVGAALRRPPVPLGKSGQIVRHEIDRFPAIYQGIVTIDNYTIMPNHVHLLLSIHPEYLGGRRNIAPAIPSVINQFKGCVCKGIGFPCWQKSFHDHIIRNQQDFRKIWEYIDANPGKWTEDRYFIPVDE